MALSRLAASRPSPKASCSAPSSRASRSTAASSPAARSTASRRSRILTGVALVFGYGLLGAGWLILKTEGELQAWARRHGRWCFIGVVAAVGIVSIWTPFVDPDIAAALVLLAQHAVSRARADRHRAGGVGRSGARSNNDSEVIALRGCGRPVPAVLSRHRHQPVAR